MASYFTAAGKSPPTVGNPADFYLDIITPGVRGSHSDELVERYIRLQKGSVEAAVDAMIEAGGKGPLEVLENIREKRGRVFKVLPVRDSLYSVPLSSQISTLMRRSLTLTGRDMTQLLTRFGMSIMQGLIIGIAFLDIGKKLPVQQLSFLFMLLQIGALANLVVMPEMIAKRLVFKIETSDALYSPCAAVFVDTLVNNAMAIAGNFVTSVIMYSLSGLAWSDFGTLYFWSFMCFIVG